MWITVIYSFIHVRHVRLYYHDSSLSHEYFTSIMFTKKKRVQAQKVFYKWLLILYNTCLCILFEISRMICFNLFGQSPILNLSFIFLVIDWIGTKTQSSTRAWLFFNKLQTGQIKVKHKLVALTTQTVQMTFD